MNHAPFIRHVDNGTTAVLCIHGILGSPRQFDMFIPEIPDDVGVYSLLLHGHGGSVLTFGHSSMHIWKRQVDDMLQELMAKYKYIIIAAHSMGTFFAIDAAIKYPERITSIFLLASPLKISVTPFAIKNCMKTLFHQINLNDKIGIAYLTANSVTLNLRLWEYATWIPRYIELFTESRRARKTVTNLSVPCCFYQSKKDELVSKDAIKYIPHKENIRLKILENSNHFIYDTADKKELILEFQKLF